jgi:hypothetical protein
MPHVLTPQSLPDCWLMSDVFGQYFWSQGAPFPHNMPKWSVLSVLFLDGHVTCVKGRPIDQFK